MEYTGEVKGYDPYNGSPGPDMIMRKSKDIPKSAEIKAHIHTHRNFNAATGALDDGFSKLITGTQRKYYDVDLMRDNPTIDFYVVTPFGNLWKRENYYNDDVGIDRKVAEGLPFDKKAQLNFPNLVSLKFRIINTNDKD